MDAIGKERKTFTPESGFNLIGLDWFAVPGEKMFLIAHYDSLEQAEAAQKKYKDSLILPA